MRISFTIVLLTTWNYITSARHEKYSKYRGSYQNPYDYNTQGQNYGQRKNDFYLPPILKPVPENELRVRPNHRYQGNGQRKNDFYLPPILKPVPENELRIRPNHRYQGKYSKAGYGKSYNGPAPSRKNQDETDWLMYYGANTYDRPNKNRVYSPPKKQKQEEDDIMWKSYYNKKKRQSPNSETLYQAAEEASPTTSTRRSGFMEGFTMKLFHEHSDEAGRATTSEVPALLYSSGKAKRSAKQDMKGALQQSGMPLPKQRMVKVKYKVEELEADFEKPNGTAPALLQGQTENQHNRTARKSGSVSKHQGAPSSAIASETDVKDDVIEEFVEEETDDVAGSDKRDAISDLVEEVKKMDKEIQKEESKMNEDLRKKAWRTSKEDTNTVNKENGGNRISEAAENGAKGKCSENGIPEQSNSAGEQKIENGGKHSIENKLSESEDCEETSTNSAVEEVILEKAKSSPVKNVDDNSVNKSDENILADNLDSVKGSKEMHNKTTDEEAKAQIEMGGGFPEKQKRKMMRRAQLLKELSMLYHLPENMSSEEKFEKVKERARRLVDENLPVSKLD